MNIESRNIKKYVTMKILNNLIQKSRYLGQSSIKFKFNFRGSRKNGTD